jgi:3-deoxy-D-manno-octulosonic-acid transferase
VVFIGGSLLPLGGQNPIEAFSVRKSVLIGPYTFNFSEITEKAILAGAAQRVDDVNVMLDTAYYLLRNSQERFLMDKYALDFFLQNRGAVKSTMNIVTPFINFQSLT